MAPRNTHWTPALALLLAAIAGFTDVVGYLTLHQVFTAHMTGNTSKLGIAIGTANVWAALPLAAAVALFAVGVGVGTLACDLGRRWQALLGQAILMAAFTAVAASAVRHGSVADHTLEGFYVLLALATVALGVQTAALTHIDATTVRTSYISGILTQLAQTGVRRLAGRRSENARPTLWTALCLCYLAGATLAGRGMESAGTWCLAAPVGLLVWAAAVDRRLARRGARAQAGRRGS
jgi:uncharacterized membrane protein YoaK (UPF0700 family)